MQFLVILCLLFVQTEDLRTWTSTVGTKLKAKYEDFENGNVKLKTATGELKSVAFSRLSTSDQRFVMRAANWGRVWRDTSGRYETVAELISFDSKSVKLERPNGEAFELDINKLSQRDQEFVASLKSPNPDILPGRFEAKVVGVADGDSLVVLLNKKQFRVRLQGIDAPEYGQPFSNQAKQKLGSLIVGKKVRGETYDSDNYGRSICVLKLRARVSGENRVDYIMLKSGLAWHYTRYSDDRKRASYEKAARSAKEGLWKDPSPTPPWDWRRRKN